MITEQFLYDEDLGALRRGLILAAYTRRELILTDNWREAKSLTVYPQGSRDTVKVQLPGIWRTRANK